MHLPRALRTAAHSRLSALVASSYPESMRACGAQRNAFGVPIESEAGAQSEAGAESEAGGESEAGLAAAPFVF